MCLLLQADHSEKLEGTFRAFGCREHIAVIHGQHGVLQQGEHGQQLKELEDNSDVASAPESSFTFGH